MSSTLAFIFARGGSRGLPGKNLRMVGGSSLLARAIFCAKGCPQIDGVVVSTDDAAIADEALTHGALVPELRPPHLATDTAPELLAWKHAVSWFCDGEGRPDFDLFVSVPPTAPLRGSDDLTRCVDAYRAGDCDMVVTGTMASRHPAFNMVRLDASGYARLVTEVIPPPTRRQDVDPVYDLTTVAYVCSPDHVLRASAVLEGRVRMVEIDRDRAIDIDDEIDLTLAEILWQKREGPS